MECLLDFNEFFRLVHYEGCYQLWSLTCVMEESKLAKVDENLRKTIYMGTHDSLCPVYKKEFFSNKFVRLTSKSLFLDFYDEIVYAIGKIFKKHPQHSTNAEFLLRQIEIFVDNPCGYVLIHTKEDKKIDGLVVALAVPGENPWLEIIALWCETGKFKLLKDEGLDLMRKWAWETHNITREYAVVTRAPGVLFEKFYKPLGFEKIGLVLEKK